MCFMPKVQAPPPGVQPEDASVGADRERKRLANKQGFASTIMTSPAGDTSAPNLSPKTLMGGGGKQLIGA